MDELEKFIGKWKLTDEENAIEYAKAFKLPEDQKRKMEEYLKIQSSKKPEKYEIFERKGDTLTVTNQTGAQKNTITFTLGKEFQMPALSGPLKTVIVLDGNKLRYTSADALNELHGIREVIGNEAIMEMVANGVSTRKKYVRVH